jgi:hypothetical protein
VALKWRGASPISASDLSPSRRALAMQLGADIVLDPAEGTGFPDFADLGVPANSLQRSASIGMGSAPPRGDLRGGRTAGHDPQHHRRGTAGQPDRGRGREHAR